MLNYLWIAIASAAATAATSFLLLRLSKKFNLAPAIRDRDVHTSPTPRLGGVAMFVGIVVAFALASTREEFDRVFDSPNVVWAILGASALIVAVGVLDDIFDLDWMLKLGVQILAASLLALQGVQIVSVPIGNSLVVGSPVVNFVLTVFVLTLMMNAVNFIDGLDGLVAGVAIIANAVFFVYTLLLVEQESPLNEFALASLLAASLVAVSAGFLPFNWHRAKMFMGDTGSLLIGLLMAVSTIVVTGQLSPTAVTQQVVLASYIPILLPVAVLVVPLVDFALAVIRRVRAGKSPFSADRKHLHHRLLDMGHSPVQAVVVFYLWTAVLSIGFLLVYLTQSYLLPGLFIAVGGIALAIVTVVPLDSRKRAEVRAQRERQSQAEPHSAVNDPLDRASTQPIPKMWGANEYSEPVGESPLAGEPPSKEQQ